MNKVYAVSDDQFKKLIISCTSYSEVLTTLGLSPNGGTSSKLLKRRITELGVCIKHFKPQTANAVRSSTKFKMDEILVENSKYLSISSLKKRLVREGLMQYACTECGLGDTWNGKPITLQLDHINGVHNDHRLTNLRFLCPNCHSQTESYAGRNKNISVKTV